MRGRACTASPTDPMLRITELRLPLDHAEHELRLYGHRLERFALAHERPVHRRAADAGHRLDGAEWIAERARQLTHLGARERGDRRRR